MNLDNVVLWTQVETLYNLLNVVPRSKHYRRIFEGACRANSASLHWLFPNSQDTSHVLTNNYDICTEKPVRVQGINNISHKRGRQQVQYWLPNDDHNKHTCKHDATTQRETTKQVHHPLKHCVSLRNDDDDDDDLNYTTITVFFWHYSREHTNSPTHTRTHTTYACTYVRTCVALHLPRPVGQ